MSLAAVLRRAGHAVKIHVREEHLMKLDFDWPAADALLRRTIEDYRPDMVGLSAVTPGLPEAQTIAAWAKEICGRQTITIVGGPHPSALPEQTLEECPDIDAAAVGEGESAIVTVAESGLREGIAGLAMRLDGRIVPPLPPRPVVADLDSLPETPYDLLDMDFYTQRSRFLIRWLDVRATNIRTSRGCTHACGFCGGHLVAGVGVRTHSLDRVMAQVRLACEKFGVEAVHFEDDTLGAQPERLMELCERLRQGGLAERLKWDCCLRVDQADARLLAAMKSAGCVQVEYGFESGSDASLGALGKATSAELNRRAVELTRQARLRVFADIMVALPGQTQADFQATERFLRWGRPEVVSAVRLAPLPGTAVYNRLPEALRRALRWEDLAYFDLPEVKLNLTAMSDERLARLWRRFSRYYVRPVTLKGLLRDCCEGDVEGRRRLGRRWRSFCLRHPLRAISLSRKKGTDSFFAV